jgi:ribosome biogenesis GTPase
MLQSETLPGLVVRTQSGFFDVETPRGEIRARLARGLTRGRRKGDAVALGDRVGLRVAADGSAEVESVEPRVRSLRRRAPGADREQVLVANPDQALFVFACRQPEPNFGLLDRYLVAAEQQGIPARICLNKIDLGISGAARARFEDYRGLGYPVDSTSAETGEGIPELARALTGKVTVLSGLSGAGKSSLINRLRPDLSLRTGEVGPGRGEGRHTTVFSELLALPGGGYVADTPGLRAFGLWDIEPSELDGYFPEMRDRIAGCEFRDCSHTHEPGCAVRDALAQGLIHPDRYASYVNMRSGESDSGAR